MIEPGFELGNYRIIKALGSGGMADVYEVVDKRLGRHLALKLLPVEMTRSGDLVARFEKEIQAAAALSHPNIVTLFEFGHDESYHFYTMQLLPGGDLRAKIRKGMDLREVFMVMRGVTSAFVHAHVRGFVHRDVKPENIMFDEHGTAVLTDFGIAKAMDSQTRMTMTGMAIGTPRYISPEQARGRPIDGRSDIYSLGCILYEMLAGKPPYDANDAFALVFQHISDPIPQLPEQFAELQPLLESLMAKEKEDRCVDAQTLLAEIDNILPRDWTGGVNSAVTGSITAASLTGRLRSVDELKTPTVATKAVATDQLPTVEVPATPDEPEIDETEALPQSAGTQKTGVDPTLEPTVLLKQPDDAAQDNTPTPTPPADEDFEATVLLDASPREPEPEAEKPAERKSPTPPPKPQPRGADIHVPARPKPAAKSKPTPRKKTPKPKPVKQPKPKPVKKPVQSAGEKRSYGVWLGAAAVGLFGAGGWLILSPLDRPNDGEKTPLATASPNISSTPAPVVPQPNAKAAKLYRQGQAEQRDGNLRQAAQTYRRLLELYPDAATAALARDALVTIQQVLDRPATPAPSAVRVTPQPTAAPRRTAAPTAKPTTRPTALPTAKPQPTAAVRSTPAPTLDKAAQDAAAAQQLMQDAAASQRRGDLQNAKAVYQQVLQLYPASGQAQRAGEQVALINKTLAAQEQAQRQRQRNAQAQSLLDDAQRLESRGRLQDARNAYARIISDFSNTPQSGEAATRIAALDEAERQQQEAARQQEAERAAEAERKKRKKKDDLPPMIGF